MPEGSSRSSQDNTEGGRLWTGLRNLLFGEEHEPTLREEIEEALDEHEDDLTRPNNGDLTPLERQMLKNLLHFGERDAGDVGVPRADIIAIPETASFAELVTLFAECGHSRLPVYQDSLDTVIGMIHVKDVFAHMASGEEAPDSIESFVREPLYVPQSMGVLDLLAEMRTKRTHLAIVLDEYSGTEGVITIEDLVEEIVGDIEDEHDEAPEALIVPLDGGGAWEADARAELEDIAELVDPRLAEAEEDIDTIGGLAVVLAERVPEVGECIAHGSGWTIEIVAADDRRVERVRLHPPKRAIPSDES